MGGAAHAGGPRGGPAGLGGVAPSRGELPLSRRGVAGRAAGAGPRVPRRHRGGAPARPRRVPWRLDPRRPLRPGAARARRLPRVGGPERRRGAPVTRLAQVTFALLAVATFSAFFVAQRLKRAPPLILRTNVVPDAFSPNGDGIRDRVQMAVRLKQTEEVSVSVVDQDGDVVRDLVSDRRLAAGRRLRVTWDGHEDDGRRAPDGFYKFHLGLRRSGRSVNVPRAVRLDTTAPSPRITRVAGRAVATVRGPLMATAGRATPVGVRFSGSTLRRSELEVVRTDLPRPRVVARATGPALRRALRWPGTVRRA